METLRDAGPEVQQMMADLKQASPDKDADGATAAELLAGAARPGPAKDVAIETVQAMLTERNKTLATVSEQRAGRKVDDAVRAGHISPGMKAWALALCRSDEASLDKFLASTPAPFAQIAPFVQVQGPDKTVEFLLTFGGAESSLAENPREESHVARALGLEDARALGQLRDAPRRIPLPNAWIAACLRSRG